MDHDILLVDDNPGMIQLMGRALSGMGKLRFATTGSAALAQMHHSVPDLVLLDAEMPGMSGYEVCHAMHDDPALADVPVIFVTSHSGPEFELKGLQMGAADFIAKPISEQLLIARVKTQLRVKRLTDELRRIATIDALTEVHNRRSFDAALAQEWNRGLRTGDPISLLMIDVDHFKHFNDRYGHPAGDACLRSVAQALRGATLRPGDLVARYGGEEFAVLLPLTPREGAEHMAGRVLEAIEQLGLVHASSPTAGHVTVSIGIGCYDTDSACWLEPASRSVANTRLRRSANDLVQCADKALYAAKSGGRARACLLDIDEVDTQARARDVAFDPRAAAIRTHP